MISQKVIENLEKNEIKVIVAEKIEQVKDIIKDIIPKGSMVTTGGSMSLKESGVIELLQNGDYNFLDRSKTKSQEDADKIYQDAHKCDFYLCSSNAVTENGELYNVDGNCNRISAIAHGPKKVIMVVGENKIVKDLNEAVYRVKTISAPLNTKRLNCNTYCKENGRCVSLNKENPQMTDGCMSENRICCNYLVSGKQRFKERITLILVKDKLGY